MLRTQTVFHRLAFAACVLLGLTAARTATAQATVAPGWDLFETVQPTSLAGVAFMGVPLGTFDFGSGPVAVGQTDTIVQRLGAASVGSTPGTAPPVPIELVALQLQSTAPTDFGLGVGTYFITLQSARGGPASTGTQTITFADPAGGTFDSIINVAFDVRLGALNGPIALSNILPVSATGVPWGRIPTLGTLTINGVNFLLDGTDMNQDFWPVTPFTETGPLNAIHTVQNAQGATGTIVPEPGVFALLVGAGFAGMGLLRRRTR